MISQGLRTELFVSQSESTQESHWLLAGKNGIKSTIEPLDNIYSIIFPVLSPNKESELKLNFQNSTPFNVVRFNLERASSTL